MSLTNKKLKRMFICGIVVALTIPLFNIFLIYPHFSEVMVKNFENSAENLANHIKKEFDEKKYWNYFLEKSINIERLNKILNKYISDFNLFKINIYSYEGRVLFSSDKSDIGRKNTNPYFSRFLSSGENFSKIVENSTFSLEGQKIPIDVVEVYVPSLNHKIFPNVIEIYYNVTEEIKILNSLIVLFSVFPFLLSALLLCGVYWGFKNLDKSLIEKSMAEKEVQELRGILPICMYCKGIRDDKGYWDSLENYISQHSEIKFSHGICESCLQENHKELYDVVHTEDETQKGTVH